MSIPVYSAENRYVSSVSVNAGNTISSLSGTAQKEQLQSVAKQISQTALADTKAQLKGVDPFLLVKKAMDGTPLTPAEVMVVASDPESSLDYAQRVLKSRFPEGEKVLEGTVYATEYNRTVLNSTGPLLAEPAVQEAKTGTGSENTLAAYNTQADKTIDAMQQVSKSMDALIETGKRIEALSFSDSELELESLPTATLNPVYQDVNFVDPLKLVFKAKNGTPLTPAELTLVATDPQTALDYANLVLKAPFPEGLRAIKSDPAIYAEYKNKFMNDTVIATVLNPNTVIKH